MTRLNGVRDSLMNVSVAWMVAAAIAAGATMGVGGGTQVVAAQPVPALLTTMPTLGPGPILAPTPTPTQGPLVVLVAYGGYEMGRYVWTKYDGPRVTNKAYEATRQAAGSVMRFSKAALKTVGQTTLRVGQAARSQAVAAYRWLRE